MKFRLIIIGHTRQITAYNSFRLEMEKKGCCGGGGGYVSNTN